MRIGMPAGMDQWRGKGKRLALFLERISRREMTSRMLYLHSVFTAWCLVCWMRRKASVDEGDDIANYKVVLEKHINRMKVAEAVITELRPKMAAFHAKVGGSLAKIEGLFTDMAPEPQKGKPMPPGMINALLRVPKEADTCGEADFIECFQRKFFFFFISL
jgi:hypothetical protein